MIRFVPKLRHLPLACAAALALGAVVAHAAGTPAPGGTTSPTTRPTLPSPLARPDLVPLGITFQGTGTNFTWVTTVKNVGTAESPATSLGVILLKAPNGAPSECYKSQGGFPVPPLQPGQVWTLPPPYQSWASTGWTLAKLKACGGVWALRADEYGKADESNETNNVIFVPNK